VFLLFLDLVQSEYLHETSRIHKELSARIMPVDQHPSSRLTMNYRNSRGFYLGTTLKLVCE
jgi:hypothetical protein